MARGYKNNAIRPDLAIGVPLADGSLAEIEHLPVESAIKTLGSMTCPTGSSAAVLGRMQQQGQEPRVGGSCKVGKTQPLEHVVYDGLEILAPGREWH